MIKDLVKKLSIFFVALTCFSCKPFVEQTLESVNTDSKLVTLNIDMNTAYGKVSCIPDFTSLNIVKFNITASADGKEDLLFTVTDKKLNILLDFDIEWTVVVEGFDDADNVLVKGTKKVTPTSSNKNFKVTVSPYQANSDPEVIDGKATVDVLFPNGGCKYTYSVYLDGDNSPKFTGTTDDTETNTQLVTFTFNNLKAGIRQITMVVSNSKYPPSRVVKYVFNIIVYSNLTSSKVITSEGTTSDYIELSEEELIPASYSDYVFYVSGISPSTTSSQLALSNGKKGYVNFASIQEAFNFIEKIDADGAEEIPLYIDGNFMLSPTAGTYSLLSIGSGSNYPRIKIIGLGAKTINCESGLIKGRVLHIHSGAQVTIENLILSGGDVADNGGGILLDGSLTLKNTTIVDCKATGTGKGNAIYVSTTGSLQDRGGNNFTILGTDVQDIYLSSGTTLEITSETKPASGVSKIA